VWGQLSLAMTLPISANAASSVTRGSGQNFVDTYSMPAIPWTADPTASYNSLVTYTVTQN